MTPDYYGHYGEGSGYQPQAHLYPQYEHDHYHYSSHNYPSYLQQSRSNQSCKFLVFWL